MNARQRATALLLAFVAVSMDQVTKRLALTELARVGSRVRLPGPVDLTFNLNASNAFGLAPVVGQATRWLLMGVNVAVAALLLVVIARRRRGAVAACQAP